MAEVSIYQLPDASALGGTETLPLDDGTATRKTTVGALRAGLAAAVHTHATAEVTGLQTVLDTKAAKATPTFTGAMSQTVTGQFDGHTITAYTAGSMNSAFRGRGARGTEATPQSVASGDAVVDFIGLAHDGAGWRNVGLLRIQVDGAPSGGAVPGALVLMTANAAGGLTEVLRCRSDGGVGHNGNSVTIVDAGGLLSLRSYTVATLPTASPAGRLVYVANGAASKRLAVSDGTVWRWPDGSVVS